MARWNARLEREELESTMVEGNEDDDNAEGGEEANSLGLKIPKTPSMLAVEIKAIDDQANEVAEPVAASVEPQTIPTSEGVTQAAEDVPTAQP